MLCSIVFNKKHDHVLTAIDKPVIYYWINFMFKPAGQTKTLPFPPKVGVTYLDLQAEFFNNVL